MPCVDKVESPEQRGWLTQRLLPDGDEPDPRFTLANERTFLAWMRTALALIGGGVALEAFPLETVSPILRRAAAVVLSLVGLLIAASAMARWLRVERAMRHKRALPVPSLLPVLGVGVTIGAIALLIMVVVA